MDDVFVQNRGKCLLCVIILMTRLARLTMWVSSMVWTSTTCLDLLINQSTVAETLHVPQEPIELVPAGHVKQVFPGLIGNPRELHWTSLCTVFKQSAQVAAAAPNSNALEPLLQIFLGWSSSWPLLCSSVFGVETETVEVSQLQFIDVVLFQFADEVVDMPVVHFRLLSC